MGWNQQQILGEIDLKLNWIKFHEIFQISHRKKKKKRPRATAQFKFLFHIFLISLETFVHLKNVLFYFQYFILFFVTPNLKIFPSSKFFINLNTFSIKEKLPQNLKNSIWKTWKFLNKTFSLLSFRYVSLTSANSFCNKMENNVGNCVFKNLMKNIYEFSYGVYGYV